MESKKTQLINFLIENGGLPEGLTWAQVGLRFGIEPPDKERAKYDETYRLRSIGHRTNDIWRNFIKKNGKFRLTKFTENKEGEVTHKQYKSVYPEQDIDTSGMRIKRVSKSNIGISWVTYEDAPDIQADLEKIKEVIESSVIPVFHKPSATGNGKTLLVYTSDKHYGSYVDEELAIYKVNPEKNIMSLVFDEISKVVDMFGVFDKIVVFDLGDALDGFNGKTARGLAKGNGHVLPQDKDNASQFETYIKQHRDFFVKLYTSGYASEYSFIAVGNSNHGGDFDYMAMRALEMYLNAAMPEIQTYVTRKWIDHTIIGNTAIIFTHGSDKENTKKPHPLCADGKVKAFFMDYIINNNLSKYNVIVVGGDLHQAATTITTHFKYRKVLSQFGESRWMQDNFGHIKPGISMDILIEDGYSVSIDKTFNFVVSNTGIDGAD